MERAQARKARVRRAKSKARARAKAAKPQMPAWPEAPWAEPPSPEALAQPGGIAVMQIPYAELTGTPDGSGPVTAQGLLAMHMRQFQQILAYDSSRSRFEMQRRAQTAVKDSIEKMLEQGLVESVADGAWEQYEKLMRQSNRQMVLDMLKSPLGTIASVARALSLRFARKKAERQR